MAMMSTSWLLFAAAELCAGVAVPARPPRQSSVISVSGAVPSAPGIPLEAFVSFSIEFSSFPDFAGNLSSPNTFSNNLLNNLGNLTGTKPYIRVGGNTQDYAMFNKSQEVAEIGIVDPAKSPDYPTTLTIGPSYFESYETWPDTKFTHGFDLGRNSTIARQGLIDSVPYACKALQGGKLLHWELCLNPIVTWEDGIDTDKDIAVITSHNYISGATVPGVTLQGTLMNHTSNVVSISHQLNESRLLAALPDSLEPNLPFIMGETNSLYNQGRPGLSNTFGAALWGVDFNLWCATNNISRVHMHQGTNYRYQSWQPIETDLDSKGTKAPYYGNIAVAAFMGDIVTATPNIVNLPLPNEEESAYAAYVDGKLARLIVVNMMAYNATDYNSNYTDNYPRPVERYSFQLPQSSSGQVQLQRLNANGSDAITGITFDGYSYNYELNEGMPVLLNNVTRGETATVGRNGRLYVDVQRSSAVIVRFDQPATGYSSL